MPALDNFAHIGGFAVGILGGLMFCSSIHPTKRHRLIVWVFRVIAAGLLVGFCEFYGGLAQAFPRSDVETHTSRRARDKLLLER